MHLVPSIFLRTPSIYRIFSYRNTKGCELYLSLFVRFVEAFSLFCGMAIRNAAQYEKAVVSEAKLQVAFEVMNYQAAASGVEANR